MRPVSNNRDAERRLPHDPAQALVRRASDVPFFERLDRPPRTHPCLGRRRYHA